MLLMSGCTGGGTAKPSASTPSSTTGAMGSHMAGPAVDIHVDAAVVNAKPQPWDLSTPESAVRSYLDWTTYANRIGQSTVAQSVATADEGVRVDSYIQYNVEKKRLLDQKLNSIVFGTPSSASSTGTLVPAKEQWTYSYLSIDTGNKSVGGPYSISYDTTYTVAKQKNGTWLVASVKATPKGTVK